MELWYDDDQLCDQERKLFDACKYGNVKAISQFLTDTQINLNCATEYGHTPLWIACRYNKIEVVKLLLNDERVDINKASDSGMTPFLQVCLFGPFDIMKLLLNDPRLDVNYAENEDRVTPFYGACQEGKIKTVKYILASSREVNINAKDSDGKAAIDIVRERRDEERSQIRKERDAKIIELLESFERNPNETRIKLRLEFGFAGILIFNFSFSFELIVLLNTFLDDDAASIFVSIVLLSDNYFDFKNNY